MSTLLKHLILTCVTLRYNDLIGILAVRRTIKKLDSYYFQFQLQLDGGVFKLIGGFSTRLNMYLVLLT